MVVLTRINLSRSPNGRLGGKMGEKRVIASIVNYQLTLFTFQRANFVYMFKM